MDLLTAVAVSLLPVSRLRAAAAFKELCQTGSRPSVSRVFESVGSPADRISTTPIVSKATADASAALAAAQTLDIEPIAYGDRRYPALLACIQDPPPVLWIQGDVECAQRRAVAIVGSRAATPYAVQVATRLAAELAERGIVVVSGLARGVDSAAHRGCLDAGGLTIAVTGCGLDRVYPAENLALARRIRDKGLLLSELPPGTPPIPGHFPLRNRIISGISLGIVVVEASEKSGSLITAAFAAQQGRDVMAVPGNVLTGRNHGSHNLLKDGARIVETAQDVLDDLGWTPEASAQPRESRSGSMRQRDPLLDQMEAGEVYRLEELAGLTGVTASKLLPRLMELELLGCVEAPGGGRFVKVEHR